LTVTVPDVADKKSGQDVHRGRFSGAVRTQKAQDFALVDRKGDIVDRQDITVVLHQVAYFNHAFSSLPPQTFSGGSRFPVPNYSKKSAARWLDFTIVQNWAVRGAVRRGKQPVRPA
jgi:hypothetical protein